MNEQANISRADFNLKQRFEIVMTNLFDAFRSLDPSNDRAIFEERIVGPIRDQGDLATGDRVLGDFMRVAHGGANLKLDLCTMMISFAYARQAMLTLDKDPESAANLMIDAYYWCGALTGTGQISKLKKAMLTEQGTAGAEARSTNVYGPMRDWALDVASKQPEGGWASRRAAALHIATLLAKAARANGWTPLSTNQAERTITGWLDDHPEKETLFPPRRVGKGKRGAVSKG